MLPVGADHELLPWRIPTQVVDARQHRVNPGLTDSHTHVIRGGLSYNMELRWGRERPRGRPADA